MFHLTKAFRHEQLARFVEAMYPESVHSSHSACIVLILAMIGFYQDLLRPGPETS